MDGPCTFTKKIVRRSRRQKQQTRKIIWLLQKIAENIFKKSCIPSIIMFDTEALYPTAPSDDRPNKRNSCDSTGDPTTTTTHKRRGTQTKDKRPFLVSFLQSDHAVYALTNLLKVRKGTYSSRRREISFFYSFTNQTNSISYFFTHAIDPVLPGTRRLLGCDARTWKSGIILQRIHRYLI